MAITEEIKLEGGYDPSFFQRLTEVEDRHFWFRSRNRLIAEIAKKICGGWRPGYIALEVGCGTGNVLRVLEKACRRGTVAGLELWFEGLRAAKTRTGALLVQGDVREFPFSRQFDMVGLFDVLEHMAEESETLIALRQALVPGGKLLITVPAHQSLWSYFDEASHHCRRYSPQSLREKLAATGFEVEFLSQFMACIFPLVWFVRKAGRGRRKDSGPAEARALADKEFRLIPVLNELLTALLTLEARWLSAGHKLPFGTSIIAIARKS